MKIPPARYPSPLGRMQATPMDVEATKRQGWREQHILVISDEDERLDFLERQLIRSIGERLYGSGHGQGHPTGGGHG
ncbi:hypothetical protein [Limnohabitans lacus]|uniref:Uncharacterized protein n=1 Tax=Limnohabitans lacus TaxID=3045173 RepID=A0ABT6X992_9BURK|nr:hypothetical protein [Limnohabitans sp. HM2-2]MDI9234703.1 hypothetical protein [Limnohabitans sp. HM2-2]